MPRFTKTRMVYYDNQQNTLTLENVDANLTLNSWDPKDATHGYGIARLRGATHNWSYIPFNKYGLYLSANEIYYLYHSSSKIKPKHMKLCLGHTVPIAKYPGTTNTTQLSFNNTIYSLVYELHDLENVNTENEFNGLKDFTNFRKTYDGARYSGGQRNNLTKPDIIYKFPDYNPDSQDYETYQNFKSEAKYATASTDTIPNTDLALDRTQVAKEFLPEFLKDSDHVYVLYPGENQYEYEESIGDNDFAVIDCSVQQFNEAQGTLDIRGGYHVNSDAAFKEDNHLYQEVVPRVRYNKFIVTSFGDPNLN